MSIFFSPRKGTFAKQRDKELGRRPNRGKKLFLVTILMGSATLLYLGNKDNLNESIASSSAYKIPISAQVERPSTIPTKKTLEQFQLDNWIIDDKTETLLYDPTNNGLLGNFYINTPKGQKLVDTGYGVAKSIILESYKVGTDKQVENILTRLYTQGLPLEFTNSSPQAVEISGNNPIKNFILFDHSLRENPNK